MIRSLKRKFVLLSMLSLNLLLVLIVTGMNAINYHSVLIEADMTVTLIAENEGNFPMIPKGKMPHGMSPEAPYETRFFSVVLTQDGQPIKSDIDRIVSVDQSHAEDYARQAFARGNDRGFVGDFRYHCREDGENTRITFLDCGRKLHAFRIFLRSSIIMSIAGLGLIFCIMMFSAERIIRPVAESYEKQKRFITDAGHEIKTPLSIIKANVDLLEMELGENESVSDIQQQARRLTALTNDLVFLAHMEEGRDAVELMELPISDIIAEGVNSFKAVAQAQQKELVTDIEALLSMRGNQKALQQLVSILMDNALKYSPESSPITVSFKRQGKYLRLSIKNRSIIPIKSEDLSHLFDRFYRVDSSRSSNSGGHGIGLSIASAIVAAHGGRIQAQSEDGSLEILILLPAG